MSDSTDRSSAAPGAATVVALTSHDILCHLFEADRRFGNPRSWFSKQDLLRCALVSRAFCEPALRALWRNMSSPSPLWRLLVEPVPKTQHRDAFKFFDDVYPQILSEKTYTDPARWARFIWYARFIQDLNITLFHLDLEHKKLIDALIAHNGGETIFPSLKVLWWFPSSYSDASYFPLFTPRLGTVAIDFHRGMPSNAPHMDEDPRSDMFLARLRTSSPRLHHLCVRTPLVRMGANHSHIIASFEHLRTLHLSARLSFSSFAELAVMPRLEYLSIFHVNPRGDEPNLEPSSQAHAQICAPRLTKLAIGGDCTSLTQLFTALDAPRLQSASVHAMWDGPAPRTILTDASSIDYVSCIKALASVSSASPPALTDLNLELEQDGGPWIYAHIANVLGPLLVFAKMERVSLSFPILSIVADDEDFWAVAGAWPRLREFSLGVASWASPRVLDDDDSAEENESEDEDEDEGEGEDSGTPTPTPQILECFRERCPDLRALRLPHLDVYYADVPGLFTRVPRRKAEAGHGLAHLWFGARDLRERMRGPPEPELGYDKAVEWARYILHLFPNLDAEESLKYCGWSDAALGWTEVLERVREFRVCKSQKGCES